MSLSSSGCRQGSCRGSAHPSRGFWAAIPCLHRATRGPQGLLWLVCTRLRLPVLSAHLSRDILTRNNIFHVRLSLARKKEEGGLPNQNI